LRKAGLIIFLIVVFGPIAALLLAAIFSLLSPGGIEDFKGAIPSTRHLGLLLKTFLFCLCVASGSSILGILAGSVLWRWQRGIGAWLRWLVLFLIIIPPYVHALAWTSAFNGLNAALQGWTGAWWVEVMAYAPITIGLALLGFASVDPALIEASRIRRPDFHSFRKVVLPVAMPHILAALGLVFVLSLTDYGVPSLFQLNVYPLEVYVYFAGGGHVAGALLLSLPLLIIAFGIIWLVQGGLRAVVMKPLWGARPLAVPMRWPVWMQNIQWTALALMLAQILVPIISLVYATGSWANFSGAVINADDEIGVSIFIAIAAGVLCIPIAFSVSKTLLKNNKRSRAWWFLVILPLAIPAPLIGIGLIAMWNHPGLDTIYRTLAMPVLASLARFVPLAVIVILAQLRRIDASLFDAARIYRTDTLKHWTQLILPMIAPGLLAAGCIIAALTAGELGATLIVAPPGEATLTMRIYNYLHYGASENVAGLCLLMTGITLVGGLLAAAGFRIWASFFPGTGSIRA
jgi:iron(III) transport system permease protein